MLINMRNRLPDFFMIFLVLLCSCGTADQSADNEVDPSGRPLEDSIQVLKKADRIHISGRVPENISSIEIRFSSSRNSSISSYLDVSPLNPEAQEMKEREMEQEYNIFYPVVDVRPTETMSGIATFETNLSTLYSVNAMFNEALFILNGNSITIDNTLLLNWENNIYIESGSSKMTAFCLLDRVATGEKLDLNYELLSPGWTGEISIHALPGRKELSRVTIENEVTNPEQGSLARFSGSGLGRERLVASLAATLKFTMGSQDLSEFSKTKNGLNIFYDKEARTYRRPTWVWAWGPSIKLMLDAAELPEIREIISPELLVKVAMQVGETSLKFQLKDPESPAYGIIMSRWSENRGTLRENYGYEEYYSIADAQFLAGWGWMPLYAETGDERYLQGSRLLTEVTGKLTNTFDIIPMDYMVRAGRWKDYVLNEQGFGTEGINELFRAEADPEYQEIGDQYMKMLLRKLDTEEGVWNRSYQIREDRPVPAAYHTRGVGWAMEGLLAVYELTGSEVYLEKAKLMASHLQANQLPDGSWSYNFKSLDQQEISEKGTALWSLLFYKLYHFTKDPEHLSAARKALEWCLDNQYDGPDMHAHGGLIGLSRQSGVVYRQWYPLACSYTSGFFGLAVLEELNIQSL